MPVGGRRSADPAHRQPSVLILSWRDTGHPEAGGSEVYVERVADGLAGRGHAVTICTAAYPGAPTHSVRPSGVQVLRRGGRYGVYPHAAWAYLRGHLPAADIVLEVQNGTPYLSRVWARRSRTVVLNHHVHRAQWQMIFGPVVARIGWFLESRVAPRVNRGLPYLTISNASAAEMAGIGIRAQDITVAYSGTDPAPQIALGRSSHPSISVLGRLVPHKRVELAIDAVADLAEQFPELELTVVGDGYWLPRLVEHAHARGVADRVHFTGRATEADKHRILAQSWLAVLPSAKEGWGLVVTEAGMHSTPTIAFAGAGGVTESIVDGQTGLLVPVDGAADAGGADAGVTDAGATDAGADAFTAMIGDLLRDEDVRAYLGEQARKHARRFTWERTVDIVADTLCLRAAESRDPRRRGMPS